MAWPILSWRGGSWPIIACLVGAKGQEAAQNIRWTQPKPQGGGCSLARISRRCSENEMTAQLGHNKVPEKPGLLVDDHFTEGRKVSLTLRQRGLICPEYPRAPLLSYSPNFPSLS